MVRRLDSGNAGSMGSIPGQGTKVPHAPYAMGHSQKIKCKHINTTIIHLKIKEIKKQTSSIPYMVLYFSLAQGCGELSKLVHTDHVILKLLHNVPEFKYALV